MRGTPEAETSRAPWADIALFAPAALFASVSLSYSFGRDQSIFFYVGREWATRGALPYRDTFDLKSPFVYAVHAALVTVTGENTWAIRACEILAVLAIGVAMGRTVAAAEGREVPGATGAATFAATFFYFAYFPFQDTGNCEVWCALFVALALFVLRCGRAQWLSAVAGAFLGLAVLAKPPAILFLPVALYADLKRGGRLLPGLALQGAATVAVVLPVLGYFAARGGLDALVDVLVRANASYVAYGRAARTPLEIARSTYAAVDWFFPLAHGAIVFLAVALAGTVRRPGARWKRAERWLRPVALAASGYAAVAWQGKFFIYHYELMILACAALAATIYAEVWKRLPVARRPLLPTAFALALAVPCLALTPHDIWLVRARNAALVVAGRMTRKELQASFTIPKVFEMSSALAASEWLRARSTLTDDLLVRGYEPEIYALSGLRWTGGRFFFTGTLTDPARAYRRDAWLAEDRAAIEAHPPRWVVALEGGNPIDSPAWFEDRGWTRRTQMGDFVILER